jgi:hypothetical protein
VLRVSEDFHQSEDRYRLGWAVPDPLAFHDDRAPVGTGSSRLGSPVVSATSSSLFGGIAAQITARVAKLRYSQERPNQGICRYDASACLVASCMMTQVGNRS